MTSTTSRSWHIDHWPILAWVETLLKLAALVFGFVAGFQAITTTAFKLMQGWQLVEFIILFVLSLGLLAAVFDRWTEREIIAMIFVVLNNLGHWGMIISLAGGPWPTTRLLLFAGLMLLGDVVKLVFIRRHRFAVREYSSSLLIGLTAIYILGYLLLIVIELLR